MKIKSVNIILVGLIFVFSELPVFSKIILDSPAGGFTTEQTVNVSGSVTEYNFPKILLVLNGLPQQIPLVNGKFNYNLVVAPGNNLIEIKAGSQIYKTSFFAKVPTRDIKVLLTWDTPSFVDLWVIDPSGEKCYWSNTLTKNGGSLIYDDSTFAPQTFTMVKALPGTYTIQIQNYGAFGYPCSRVKVYLVLYEGTPREERREFTFIATKEETVYHITDFVMGE